MGGEPALIQAQCHPDTIIMHNL